MRPKKKRLSAKERSGCQEIKIYEDPGKKRLVVNMRHNYEKECMKQCETQKYFKIV